MAISEVIQCSAEAQNYLVWKHPEENFNTTSQLMRPFQVLCKR